jgi:hypothetical protein
MAAVEVIEIKGDASSAVKAYNDVGAAATNAEKKSDDFNQTSAAGMSALDKATGGAITAFKGLSGGLRTAVMGFKTLKGAIIATGLGALLIAVTSLVAYFTKTERGAKQLRVIMSTLGAVVGKLTDVVIALGENLFNIFTNPKEALVSFAKALRENIINRLTGMLELLPALGKAVGLLFKGEFKAAGKVAADAVGKVTLGVESVTEVTKKAVTSVSNFTKGLGDAAKEGKRVADELNAVTVAERELITQRAEANKKIAEARLIADDLTKSTEERMAAIKLAAKLEEEVAEKELQTQKRKTAALQAQADISESDEATLNEIAENQARLSELEQASIQRKKRLGMEVQALNAEIKGQTKSTEALATAEQKQSEARQKQTEEQIKREQELVAMQEKALSDFNVKQGELLDQAFQILQSDQEREINAIRDKYFAILQLDELSAQDRVAIEEKQQAEITEISRKYAKVQQDIDKATADAKAAALTQNIDNIQGALGSLFQNSKAVATANVLVDSAQAAVGIFKSSTSLPEPAASINRGIQLAALAASAAASIRNINRAEPTAAATSAPSTPSTPTVQSQAPQFNVVGQGGINQLAQSIGGQFSQPVRAYVVGGEVTTAQQLERQRVRTATFG